MNLMMIHPSSAIVKSRTSSTHLDIDGPKSEIELAHATEPSILSPVSQLCKLNQTLIIKTSEFLTSVLLHRYHSQIKTLLRLFDDQL